jgi:hypothetical protein
MGSLQESMIEYRKQLEKGTIQIAYRGLMDYILSLKTHFSSRHPEYAVSGTPYFGYMDMTYFSIVPEAYRQRGLKIAVVFLHEAFRFEVWLAAANKQVQKKTWEYFKDSGWNQYRIVPAVQGYDSILEQTLVDDPDFSDLPALTGRIEQGTLDFIREVEKHLP